MDETDHRMPLTSADVLAERVEKLKQLIPEVFSEGTLSVERLKHTLGDFVGEGKERYGLSWAGKADAVRAIQATSIGTLLPCPNESVDFETTKNVFIEGDNLEVLKLLQKSYYGKIKMIFIDPPYNTGGEFIYPDNYREGLDGYLRYSGQIDSEGVKLSTNTETSGRYHSNWLDMMYPRLFLARNLLTQDGSIFVTIGDDEAHNLRLLMDEVFGPENFLATVVWQKVFAPKPAAKGFSSSHDYVLVYARDATQWQRFLLPRTAEQDDRYQNPDGDSRGSWASDNLLRNEHRDNSVYTIVSPMTGKEWSPKKGTSWRHPQDEMQKLIANNEIWFGKDGHGMPRRKKFLKDVQQGLVPETMWPYKDVGHTQDAKREIINLFGYDAFPTPKPTKLVRRALQLCTQGSDIVLDFFAGSSTTGHAVYDQNRADGGKRTFVLVQLPEPLADSEYSTVADIGKDRLRRALKSFREEKQAELDFDKSDEFDFGFKVFRLASSNFRIWDTAEAADASSLSQQLPLFADHLLADRSEMDVLYEIVLKAGLPLTADVSVKEVEGAVVYSVAEGLVLVCLANPITQEVLRGIVDCRPERVVCLDAGFGGNDQLKTNTVLEMKSHGIEFRTV